MEIESIDLAGKTDIADYMIVASGTSSRHVSSIARTLISDLKTLDIKGIEPEGMNEGEWVLVDAGNIIAHIFKPETREKYDIEGMWKLPAAKKKEKKEA